MSWQSLGEIQGERDFLRLWKEKEGEDESKHRNLEIYHILRPGTTSSYVPKTRNDV
jgi:hypothetical protein